MRRLTFLLLTVIYSVSCTVGPNYKRPATALSVWIAKHHSKQAGATLVEMLCCVGKPVKLAIG